jgi:transcriptional regulator with XRE-family HTH domain
MSESRGAPEAFDVIQQYIEKNDLSMNGLAIKCGLTPSTVSRALSDRAKARWTPALRKIYSVAENKNSDVPGEAIGRLAAYKGPGEIEVKRLLTDVEQLIATLSKKQ